MSTYEVYLTDDSGMRIADVYGRLPAGRILDFSASWADGQIGRFAGRFPGSFDDNLLKPDNMIQIWRRPNGGARSLYGAYLIRKWRFFTQGGDEYINVWGCDPKHLLWRRIVAAYANEAQSNKTDYADDMMKEIVTQSIADGVAPVPDAGTRIWADLSIQTDLSAGPTLTRAFAWQKLLTLSGGGVLPALQQASNIAGTEVFFDVRVKSVSSSAISFEFVTKTGQPGADVQDVVFAQQFGNLTDPFLEFDWTEEENYIYGAGQGLKDSRVVEQVYDAARYGASKWNRCEGVAEAGFQDAPNGVRESARARLREGRPIRRAGGVPVDTQKTRFGVDWSFGDKVTFRYRGYEFPAIIKAGAVSVDENGRESITARLEYEG